MRNDFSQKPEVEAVGSIEDFSGLMCCFNDEGACRFIATDIECPNTFVWSLDDTTLYTADSAAKCLYTYRFNSASGAVDVRSVFSAHTGLGVPDGSALDVEGYLWNARWGAGCLVRFRPDGGIANVVRIPANLVTSCAFGGDALDTLFVTTASYDLPDHEFAQQPKAGGVFAFKPEVPGARRQGFRINRQDVSSPFERPDS
jgi:sugar lactone lactonase YvrE